jgi:hypothetical protein
MMASGNLFKLIAGRLGESFRSSDAFAFCQF